MFGPAPQTNRQQHCCVVKVDLVGSTHLVRTLPLDECGELLDELGHRLVTVLRDYGGHPLPLQGDAALACWPAHSTEDALQAALLAHRVTRQLGLAWRRPLELRLRAGVAAGDLALTRRDGGAGNVTPCLCGVPLHMAERLCRAAEPGETLLCECAYRQLTQETDAPLVHPWVVRETARPHHAFTLARRPLPALAGFEDLYRPGVFGIYRAQLQNTEPGAAGAHGSHRMKVG